MSGEVGDRPLADDDLGKGGGAGIAGRAAPRPNGAASLPRSNGRSTRSTRPRIAEIDGALADPKLYDRDPGRVAILGKERA
jgi:hypothetical protein